MAQQIFYVGTTGMKVQKISGLDDMASSLTQLQLRSNLIENMSGIENLTKLIHLELYDNKIRTISGIERMSCLKYPFCFVRK